MVDHNDILSPDVGCERVCVCVEGTMEMTLLRPLFLFLCFYDINNKMFLFCYMAYKGMSCLENILKMERTLQIYYGLIDTIFVFSQPITKISTGG